MQGASLSVITLDKSCSPADARKIFEIINKQGVALTNAEILSAKPMWNKKLIQPRQVIIDNVKELYRGLGIEQNDVVSWDVAATLTSRLSEYSDYIFGKLRTTSFIAEGKTAARDIDRKVNYGFKLLAGRYSKKINKIGVEEIPDKIKDWNSDEFELEIGAVTKLLYTNDEFIRYFASYKYSLSALIGDTVAMNYLFVLIEKYNSNNPNTLLQRGKPRKQFIVSTRVLLDRLFYEYVKGEWSGSSDSRLKKNLDNYDEMFKPIPEEDWNKLIDEAYTKNTIGGQPAKKNRLIALLYYFSALMKKDLQLKDDMTSHVDHIIPESEFVNDSDKKKKDTLINYALLSSFLNEQKKNSYSKIESGDIKKKIAELEDLSIETLSNLRNPGDFDTLYKERIGIKDKIKTLRKHFVAGELEWVLNA